MLRRRKNVKEWKMIKLKRWKKAHKMAGWGIFTNENKARQKKSKSMIEGKWKDKAETDLYFLP